MTAWNRVASRLPFNPKYAATGRPRNCPSILVVCPGVHLIPLTKPSDALRHPASKSARQMLHYLVNLPVDIDAPKSFHILVMPKKLNVIVMGSVRGNLDARHKT